MSENMPAPQDQSVEKNKQTDAASNAAPKIIKPGPRSIIIMSAVAIAGLLLILYAWRIWPFGTGLERTDNSYVRGRLTVLAPQVNGYVTEVLVNDYAQVKAGQALVSVDQRVYLARRDEARGQLRNAQAELEKTNQTIEQNKATIEARKADLESVKAEGQRAIIDEKRVINLARNGSVSTRERDQAVAQARLATANVAKAKADLQIAIETAKATLTSQEGLKAQVDIAQAQLRQSEIDLDNTVIRAPRDGQIGETSVRQGQYVTAGTQLMFLVPDDIWVVANFKETQVHLMKKGMRATFTVDALGKAQLTGRIIEVSPATGSEFSVMRADNASGNFTKVVQRLPIKIQVDRDQKYFSNLRPGMSVVTQIDTQQDLAEKEK